MSKRREVEGRIEALNEIHSIMNSMKNLAMMETRKLVRYHDTQQRVVDSIRQALNDVRCHYAPAVETIAAPPVYLLFGTERGFCGGYNEQLLDMLAQQPGYQQAPLIGVGTRLADHLQRDYPDAVCLAGAAVADEVSAVLGSVVTALNQLRRQHGPLRLAVICFQPDTHEPRCLPVLPDPEKTTAPGFAPLINLPPQQLLGELLEHYLFVLINAWYFDALIAENQHRIQHLDQAGHHLEHQVEDLGKRRNALRQEEIIEEIEVILLSSELVCSPGVRP